MGNLSTSFATDYKDLITFLYYVVSLITQGLVFVFGVLYVLHRNRRQRDKDAAKEKLRLDLDDERCKEEKRKQHLQEWRKFSQELNLNYIDMTRDKVIQRLQHAKESRKVCISPNINGLDVLRFMINDEDSFPNAVMDDTFSLDEGKTFKPTSLRELRLDLRSVFVLINYCWSLCLLGEIPENFNQEMRRIVIVLGNLALPFCCKESDGHRFGIIKECLEKFGGHHPIPQQRGREELTDEIPYIKFLRYEPDSKSGEIFTFKSDALCLDYEEEPFLRKLNSNLVFAADYARKLAKIMKERSDKWISVNATDEEMVLKLIHDVRCITWKKNKKVPLDQEDDDLLQTLKTAEVKEYEGLRPAVYTSNNLKDEIFRLKAGVRSFKMYGYKHFSSLKDSLNRFQDQLKRIKIPEFVNESQGN